MENKGKQRILFVLPFLPYPLDSGGAQAIFNGIDVVKDDFDVFVTYRSLGGDDKDREQKLNGLLNGKTTILPCTFPQKAIEKPSIKQRISKLVFKIERRLRRAAGIEDPVLIRIAHKSWTIEELFPKETIFTKHVLKLVEDYRIDIVQCEMIRNITLGLALPEHVRKVFVHHELGWVVHELELMHQQGDEVEQKIWLEHYKTLEVALLNKYDDIITLSVTDTEKLKKAGVSIPIHPSLAVVNTLTNEMLSTDRWNILSFVGPECNSPNVDGLKWFLENIWEKLKEREDAYHLQIIGNWSDKTITELLAGHRDVRYRGFVNDLAAALKDTIMVVPITIGSGIRMKILEAASMGVPFVTTTVGVEGIPVENGVHCFVADTPEAFTEAIVRLQDSEMRRHFAINANQLVKERYSIESLRRNRLGIYSK